MGVDPAGTPERFVYRCGTFYVICIMKRFFLIAILALCVGSAFGQTLPFRTYSIERGLSEAVVNDLMQDEEGWLWVATGYGLNRFDGFTFENYFEEDGLLSNKIHSLYQDNNGTIWIGTGAGVNIIDQDSLVTLPELAPLKTSVILEIYQDNQDEYWFATDGQGVWHYDQAGNLTQYLTVHGLADNRVRDVLEDGNGTLWFATRGGLTSLKNGSFKTFTTADGLPEDKLRDLILDKNGHLWIATRGGISHYVEGNFQNYTEEDGLVNNRVQSLSIDNDSGLWIGTEEGASHFTEGSFKNYTVEQGLSNNIIYATLFDRENDIWFGTFGGGLSVFFGDHIRNYTTEQGLPNNLVSSITEDQDGNHWISTYGGGISRFDGSRFTTLTVRDGLVDNKVYTAMADKQNRLLIGTRWGLSILEDGKFQNFDETELPYRKIRAITQTQNEDVYWIGTYGEGVLKFEDGKFELYQEQDGLASNTVLSVEEGNDGSLWFATYGGVSRYKDGTFTNYTLQDGLPNNGVLDILKDDEDQIWFSTYSGIAMFQDSTFLTISSEEGLPDEVCYFIIQDDKGMYWIGTSLGVVRFDYDVFKAAVNASEREKAFKLITQDQGLVSNETNAGAGYKDREGFLWFGTVGGLTRYNPREAPIDFVAPKVHVKDIRVSGELIVNHNDIRVGSNNHNVSFDFVGISFRAPEQLKYEYRLRGTGEGWQKTSQRSVRYSSLIPGDYTFQVRAINNEGIQSTETASLNFIVLAPFWLQWWFLLLVLIITIGMIAFVYNYYRVHKMVEIERMRVRIASDLHDDVGSALTEIALQSDFLQTTEADDALKQSLEQIGTQSRRIVSSLDDIVWSIDARNDTMGDLTDRMQDYINNVLPDREVRYHFDNLDMANKLKVSMKENLYLIFKEAINNVAKHSNATKVEVDLTTEGDSFKLKIHDNGTDISPKRKSGHGIRNMNMRGKRIDAAVTIKNEDGFTVQVDGKLKQ